ncbi:unnamed protein product [Adineta steineri]|uniref:Uncharacterized protein n=1 Tax=Adineta steineri TaxID=433720 RepID=A0A813VG19_9BILA|nr:unnamed protein product [Adineta steineri]
MSKRKRYQTVTINIDEAKNFKRISDRSVTAMYTEGKGEVQKNLNENVTSDCITSTSSLKDEDSVEATVSTKEEMIWDNKWFEFKETPELKEIKIDIQSTLKWCPNFISKEEGDALFNHLMKGIHINIERKKSSNLIGVSFIFRIEFRAHCNFYVWKTCQTASSSVVVCRRRIGCKRAISEAEAAHLDFTNAET